MKTIFLKLIFIFAFATFFSCLSIHVTHGKAEIVNRSFDCSLQDSAMICGYVLDAYGTHPVYSSVFIENTGNSVFSDSTGYFSVKLLPGTYTVICDPVHPADTRGYTQTQKLENLTILPNEKIEVKFLITSVVE